MSIFVDIVIPVYNEEIAIERSIATIKSFMESNLSYQWRILIADNASTDKTAEIGRRLQAAHPNVGFLRLNQKGRGRALKRAWLDSSADIVSYMDVDLSTSLDSFPKLIDAIVNGYDIAIGSRLMNESQTYRSFRREFLSRTYNLFLRLMLRTHFKDAQCGFKAVSKRAVRMVVPVLEQKEWFFDTELLVLSEKMGLKIKEIPVKWIEEQVPGRKSTVQIFRSIIEHIRGVLRLFLISRNSFEKRQ